MDQKRQWKLWAALGLRLLYTWILAPVVMASTTQPAPKSLRVSVKGKVLWVVQAGEKGQVVGRLALPSKPAQVVWRGRFAYVACRRAGLLVVDLKTPQKPVVTRRLAQGRDVIGVRVEGQVLVLSFAQVKVGVLSLSEPGRPTALTWQTPLGPSGVPVASRRSPVSTTKPRPGPARKRPKVRKAPIILRSGKVIRVRRGWVVIDGGAAHGLKAGMRVAIRSHAQVRRYDPQSDKVMRQPARELTAVIELSRVSAQQASGRLGRGDRAVAGDFFETTDKPLTHRLMFPLSPKAQWRFRVGLAPVIGLDAKAVGLMSFMSLSYAFSFPLKIEIGSLPFSAVLGSPHSGFSSNMLVNASYHTDYIELILGIGYQAVVGGRSGLTLMQGIRLGSVDGLHLVFVNQLVLSPQLVYQGSKTTEGELEFQFGAIYGSINIPITPRLTLFFSGGGGSAEWYYGEVGIRTYLIGSGEPGTVVLSGSLGYASVISVRRLEVPATRSSAEGPLIAAEIDWRF